MFYEEDNPYSWLHFLIATLFVVFTIPTLLFIPAFLDVLFPKYDPIKCLFKIKLESFSFIIFLFTFSVNYNENRKRQRLQKCEM